MAAKYVPLDMKKACLTASEPGKVVSVGTGWTVLLAANARRIGFTIDNISNENVTIRFEAAAVATAALKVNGEGHVLLANGVGRYENNQENLFLGALCAICASGSKNVSVTEL